MKPRRARTVTTRQRQAAFYESRPLKLTGSGQYADAEERAFWAESARRGRAHLDHTDKALRQTGKAAVVAVGVLFLGNYIYSKVTGK